MIELQLLKAFSIKANLEAYKHLINPKTLSSQGIELLKDFEVYFAQNPEEKKIDFNRFSTFFFIERHPFFDNAKITEYKEILKNLANASEDHIKKLLNSFETQEFYNNMHVLLDKNTDFAVIKDRILDFDNKLAELSNTVDLSVNMDLDDALIQADRSGGLAWRLPVLQDHFQGGLIKGDFGIVAGYTDSGKTSFLASELSHMATQLTGDQYILWLNNEGDWRRILPRIYSAALGCTFKELLDNKEKAKARYKELMKGNENRIKIVDIQGKHVKDLERLFKQQPPALVVFDMLDHVRGFENYMGDNSGNQERYKKLYQWAREMSSQYCPMIATSQLNREGNNVMYPEVTNLEGSGVAKQGAAIFMLFIGALTGEDTVRYLSTPKFKITGNKSWCKAVKFDPSRARFL